MNDAWEDIYTCPICKTNDVVLPSGKQSSKILIIGEFPGADEIKTGRPFSGATGSVLRKELGKMGVDLSSIRIMNMWMHFPNKNEDCLKYGVRTSNKRSKRKASNIADW